MLRKTDFGNGVAAHRGNMSVFPENTLEAFSSAIDLGCSWLELDIQTTADGVLVVTHDENARRVTLKDYVITQTDFQTLQQCNFGSYVQDGKFYKLPKLADVFDLLKNTETRVTIQPKCNGVVAPAIRLAEKMGLTEKIAFNELNCEYLVEAKRLNPDIPVFWDRLPGTDIDNDIFIASQFRFDCLMYVFEDFKRETYQKITEAGLECGVCVVNDPALMDLYLSWGIKMFYTDYPSVLLNKI